MKVFNLLRNESGFSMLRLVIVGTISGISSAILLVIINAASENDTTGEDNTWLFLACVVCVLLYLFTERYVLRVSTKQVQGLVGKIRTRIVNKIRHSELQLVEELGDSEVYARITNDTRRIASTVSTMVQAFQSAIMVIFAFIYIGFLSFPAVVAICVVLVAGTVTYLKTGPASEAMFVEASKKDTEFFKAMNGILLGFKEIKINKRKNDHVFSDFKEITNESVALRIKAWLSMIHSELLTQSFFYLLLIIIIFIIPVYETEPNQNVLKISAAILFLIGPIEGVIGAIPALMEANTAANNIYNLEQMIESHLKEEVQDENGHHQEGNEAQTPQKPKYVEPLDFEKELRLEHISFEYPRKYESDGFVVGPLTMSIEKGKLTFITGGNGSGKSTLLKLLCGLYYPKTGYIMVDDTIVDEQNYQNYREMLSLIFTEFHLFDRLFGLEEINQKKVQELLVQMQLDHKTRIVDGKITDLNLSTGQRKRLALVISLLEDKSIYVFDEVAADQDPTFKKYFYTEILTQMKESGKTVVVVTHDDQYFHIADSLYKLTDGQLTSTKPN